MKTVLSFVFVIGLVLATSEGRWAPWPNLLGAGLIGIWAFILNTRERIK